MAISTTQFIEIAETLPVEMKATLVDYLLKGDRSRDDVDVVWKIEAGRRLDHVRTGGVEIIPITTVFEEIGARVQLGNSSDEIQILDLEKKSKSKPGGKKKTL